MHFVTGNKRMSRKCSLDASPAPLLVVEVHSNKTARPL